MSAFLLLLASCVMTAPSMEEKASNLVNRAFGPSSSCPNSVGAIHLPEWVDPKDPRLQHKGLIIVHKEIRRISRFDGGSMVYENGTPLCWNIGLGFTPTKHKEIQGDGKTPEGWYRTSDKPWSQFYAAIAVHYPNAKDAKGGHASGKISTQVLKQIEQALQADKKPHQSTALGGEILIHGGGSAADWTLGCVAMENEDIDALRNTIPTDIRTDVLILP